MENEAKRGGDIFALVAWADAHRKQLMWTALAVAVVGIGVGGYFMYKNSREAAANAAYCTLTPPGLRKTTPTAGDAAPYAQLADEYPETSAGTRAMLVAGRLYFEAGQFEQARAMFQRVLSEHPDFLLANVAAIGVAASLESEGKLPEATARYEEIARRGPQDSTWPQAESALGRLYTEQNHPERALDAYRQLLQARSSDSWTMEASPQLRELLDKYPALRQQLAPPSTATAPTATAPTTTAPTATAPASGPTLDLGKP